MIDSHTHIQLVSYYDLQLMGKKGVDAVITCTGSAPQATSYITVIDVTRTILKLYNENAKKIGLNVFTGIGMNPRNIPPDWMKFSHALEDLINVEKIIAIGEVGLDSGTDLERDVFREMVRLAKLYDMPLIIHTPNTNRIKIVDKEIKIIEESGISNELVEIDHAGMDILPLIKKHGLNFGITVKKGRVSKLEVLRNIEYLEDGMLNSDVTNVNESDPLAVPKTVEFLKKNNADSKIIERISDRNARKFFRI